MMSKAKGSRGKRVHSSERGEEYRKKAAVRQLNLALLLLRKRHSRGMSKDELLVEMADYYFEDPEEAEIYASEIIPKKKMGEKRSKAEEALMDAKKKMFDRDRKQIEALGITITRTPRYKIDGAMQKADQKDDTRKGTEWLYKITPDDFSIPDDKFDSVLSDQLIFALQSMRELGGPFFSDNLFSVRLKFGLVGTEAAPPNLHIELEAGDDLAEKAIELVGEKAVVTFSYRGLRDGEYKKYRAQAVGLIYRWGGWNLVAYDLGVEDYRLFRLSRIKGSGEGINILQGAKSHPLEGEMQAIKRFLDEKPWEMGKEEVTVSIKISDGEAQWAIKELGPSVISSQEGEDGDVNIDVHVKNLGIFCDWAMRKGASVEVLSPPAARMLILERAKGIVKSLYTSM